MIDVLEWKKRQTNALYQCNLQAVATFLSSLLTRVRTHKIRPRRLFWFRHRVVKDTLIPAACPEFLSKYYVTA